ncbi:GIY-YIG nuclease family protein [Patescibacteria group bacterium]|nr:GIY-YIG nuclease family protein [Patescibacteria group bacterium]
MHYVYILILSNGDYYHGLTGNLERRIKQHQHGENKSTNRFLPVELICYITFKNKKKAEDFEKYLKTGSGYAFRNRHLV